MQYMARRGREASCEQQARDERSPQHVDFDKEVERTMRALLAPDTCALTVADNTHISTCIARGPVALSA